MFSPPFLAMLFAASLRIVLIGDSTVNDEGGWGPGFKAAIAGPDVEVINLAKNGRSSKSFWDEGVWTPVAGLKPTYVLIQFGHNDCPGKGPERETDPATTYRANLKRYVDEVRQMGGTPVLVTSIVRRNFEDDGRRLKNDCLLPFVEEVRRLGPELGVPVMDLYGLTHEQAESLAPKGADKLGAVLPDGKPDRTHLAPAGQFAIGVIAAREFARAVPAMAARVHDVVPWSRAMQQKPDWYGSADAVRLADSLLAHQHKNGGWVKNVDMTLPPFKPVEGDTTIDNGATWTQMQYLARVYERSHQQRFADAYRRGFRFLIAAQYPNGGWPQFYPIGKGYYTHITFNDDAMVGVLNTLGSEPSFLSEEEKRQAREAVRRGTDVVLRTQIIVDGKRTVWCAQHDEVTLAPAKARSYELPSFSGHESVGIVRFLMGIERPSADVIAAVDGAVQWLKAHEIRGVGLEVRNGDRVVVEDPSAPPLWARFYDLKTGQPFFCGRDGVPKKTVAEIESERRNGYKWYVDTPARLIETEYPAWKARLN